MPHHFKDDPPSTNSGHGGARSLGEGSHQGANFNNLRLETERMANLDAPKKGPDHPCS